MKKNIKILFDISPLVYGNTGIQQDIKSILLMLNEIKNLQLDYLIYDMQDNWSYLNYNFRSRVNNLVKSSQILAIYSQLTKPNLSSLFYIRKIQEFIHLKKLLRRRIDIFPFDKALNESLYIFLFNDLKNKEFRNKFLRSQILFINWSLQGAVYGYQKDGYKPPTLNLENYDIVFFIQEVPLRITGAKKIVRTYDLIKIKFPNFVHQGHFLSKFQYQAIKESIGQKVDFVSISSKTANDIKKIFNDKSIRVSVIPVSILDLFSPINNGPKIDKLIRLFNSKNKYYHQKLPDQNFDYFLSVSTIEPRKNIISAYHAFKKVKLKKPNLKFVLVGKIGWGLDQGYLSMLKDEDVLVLEDVPTEYLPYFYSQAKALIFVPYEEGFGVPPLEAMACKCPVIISDIPVHREIHADGQPIFVSPYDIDNISDAMNYISDRKNLKSINLRLEKGLKHAEKYRMKEIKKTWEEFIKKILD